ncbi:MAG TPA: hypothetical protein IAA09_02250 [Candidatus Lachnoclostridium avicola]|nr:hypothetical protein [Candidatus Lachnoclostridium avicola]
MAKVKGSMTVEAALGFTLFLFFMALMAAPLSVMDTRRQVQAGLEAEGERIAQYAYAAADFAETGEPGLLSGLSRPDLLTDLSRSGLLSGLSREAVCRTVENRVKTAEGTGRAVDFSAAKSRILEDGETIDLIVDYAIRLPFPVFFLDEIPQQARCIRRAWTGKDGLGAEGSGRGDEENEIVYMGKDGSRYHRSRTCHYLYNDLRAVSAAEVKDLRSQSGNRYRPCAVCGVLGGPVVYVMPSGESYHFRKDCSSIAAYVRAVPLKSVEHLGACSYCSR